MPETTKEVECPAPALVGLVIAAGGAGLVLYWAVYRGVGAALSGAPKGPNYSATRAGQVSGVMKVCLWAGIALFLVGVVVLVIGLA